MIIQVILTLSFLAVAVYGWAHLSRVRLISSGMVLLSVVAIGFVWKPDLASRLATLLGVGRGTDLVLYSLFVFVVFQFVILHVKLNTQMTLITQLARQIALDQVVSRDGGELGRPQPDADESHERARRP